MREFLGDAKSEIFNKSFNMSVDSRRSTTYMSRRSPTYMYMRLKFPQVKEENKV